MHRHDGLKFSDGLDILINCINCIKNIQSALLHKYSAGKTHRHLQPQSPSYCLSNSNEPSNDRVLVHCRDDSFDTMHESSVTPSGTNYAAVNRNLQHAGPSSRLVIMETGILTRCNAR